MSDFWCICRGGEKTSTDPHICRICGTVWDRNDPSPECRGRQTSIRFRCGVNECDACGHSRFAHYWGLRSSALIFRDGATPCAVEGCSCIAFARDADRLIGERA